MKEKITKKQILYLLMLTLAVCTPFLSWYHKLDLQLKFKYVIIPWICLIFALLAIGWLIDSVRDNGKNNHKNTTKVDDFQKISIDERIPLIHRLRCLSPCSFEHLIEKLFQLKWYEIIQPPTYLWNKPQVDNWCDLIVKKWNDNIYVQIKKNIANLIQEKQLKEFKGWFLNNKLIYITTSLYSKNAKRYADKNKIELIDYNWLLDRIQNLKPEEKQQIEKFINDKSNLWDSKYLPKTCIKCWAPIKSWKFSLYCLNRYEDIQCCNKKYIS